MGYDMYWAEAPEDTDKLALPYLEAQERWNKAIEARDAYVESKLDMSFNEARRIQYLAGEASRTDSAATGKNLAATMPAQEEQDRAREFWDKQSQLFADDPEARKLQEACQEAYEQMGTTKKWYFRANIWGMGMLREYMEQSRMLDWDAGPPAAFPEPAEFNVPSTTRKYGEEEYAEYDEESPEWAKFEEAQELTLRRQSDNMMGIPGFKLSDNSGWWVTPDEITVALALHDTYLAEGRYDKRFYDRSHRQFQEFLRKSGSDLASDVEPEPEQTPEEQESNFAFFLDWIEFLREAADHGGVRVY